MSELGDPRKEWEEFLEYIYEAATHPVDLPPLGKEIYFRRFKKDLVPKLCTLADETRKKGKPAPITAETPRIYYHNVTHNGPIPRDYLSFSVHSLINPSPYKISQDNCFNETAVFYLSDGTNSISLHQLDNGEFAIENDNKDGTTRLLNSLDALFDTLPSHRLYPAGNPASWINKLVANNMIQRMKDELKLLPERKV